MSIRHWITAAWRGWRPAPTPSRSSAPAGWPRPKEVPARDELGELAATFSRVAVGRRETEDELRRMHEELEHRVAQRTRDLARANAALEAEIEERQRAEALLLESERYAATGRMAARIAHEINNPLAGIKNAFRLVKDSIPADHPHFKYVGRIDREIDRVARIVRQMYGIYRPESEGVRRFRVDEAIEDVVALLTAGGTLEESPLIAVELDQARTTVNQVEGTLRQILYNLLQNAIEASPAGTPVEVRARVNGEQLVIAVADRGVGIGESDRARVFEPFFTTKEGVAGAGLGLGLAISYRSAMAMGGRLEFESEPGVGTTFTLSLPLDAEGARDCLD